MMMHRVEHAITGTDEGIRSVEAHLSKLEETIECFSNKIVLALSRCSHEHHTVALRMTISTLQAAYIRAQRYNTI